MSRPRKTAGTVYPRKDSGFWWISYRNREGRVVQESTGTTDRQEAERFLRQRLDARDDGILREIRYTAVVAEEVFIEREEAVDHRYGSAEHGEDGGREDGLDFYFQLIT